MFLTKNIRLRGPILTAWLQRGKESRRGASSAAFDEPRRGTLVRRVRGNG
ncbi:hypothetical protein THTE_4328 [Thermogutta terrifontis]|uniref:Uncharacterized protein n=1 Tax=Thermogutta terrifontis TaxID=1331910 RepID=A0A286RLU8_9BACT|nr:hypothetical protein THTE_4328 [Thermogutta terrifontis]